MPGNQMSVKGKPTRSLLDSGSEVTLINESYYKEHIEHHLLPSSGSYNNSHNLFSLQGVEEGNVPLSKHFRVRYRSGGQIVHRVGILVTKDKVPLVDSKGRKAKTPALLSSNLIQIAVNEFCETFGEECLRLFECPAGISPLWFSTLCLYYYAHVHKKTGVGASSLKTDDPISSMSPCCLMDLFASDWLTKSSSHTSLNLTNSGLVITTLGPNNFG